MRGSAHAGGCCAHNRRVQYRVLSALGNTFVVAWDEPGSVLDGDCARALCEEARTDGLIVLSRDPGALGDSGAARLGARVWNKDGSDGGFSGNGVRCAAVGVCLDDAREGGRYEITCSDRMYPVSVERAADGGWSCEIEIGAAYFDLDEIGVDRARVDALGERGDGIGITVGGVVGNAVTVGNPHFVVFVDDEVIEAAAVKTAEWVRNSGAFRMGVNVELCRVVDDGAAMEMIPVERGVGVTAACGSGAAAAVGAAFELGYVGERCVVQMRGGEAEIRMSGECLVLSSSVEVVGEGDNS